MAAEQLTRPPAVFGDLSAAEVFELIHRYVSDQLRTRVREVLFDTGAIGAVFGLRLMDDRDVVVKAYQPAADLDRLVEVTRCQTILNRRGFPCAAVIRPPCVIEGIPIVTEELRERTATGSPHDLAAVDILAGGLARQIQLLRDVDGSRLTPGRPAWANWEVGAWPDPHHPLFDFTKPATGYEWLDEWADEHAAVLRDACKALPYLIGHTDWVWQNVAVRDDRLAAGYDWDSLAFFPEAVVVGLSAGAFTQGSPTPPDAPRWIEVLAFLDAYQRRRGLPFNQVETHAARHAARWVRCYNARCQVDMLHRYAVPAPEGSFIEQIGDDEVE